MRRLPQLTIGRQLAAVGVLGTLPVLVLGVSLVRSHLAAAERTERELHGAQLVGMVSAFHHRVIAPAFPSSTLALGRASAAEVEMNGIGARIARFGETIESTPTLSAQFEDLVEAYDHLRTTWHPGTGSSPRRATCAG